MPQVKHGNHKREDDAPAPEVTEIEVEVEVDEVLPPGGSSQRERRARPVGDVAAGELGEDRPSQENDPLQVPPAAKVLATLLDECIQIPGTKIRIGLDPIIGLIPGIGDVIGSMLGSYLLGEAQRRGAPKFIQGRMAANVLINAILGAVPIFGDLFSVWFKSNSKNYKLLEKYAPILETGNRAPAKPSRWPAILTIGAASGISILAVYGVITLLRKLF